MDNKSNSKYIKFFAMIFTSMVVMYILMYLNNYAFDHVRFSQTRLYMTFIMGAAMAIVMLSFMLDMYKDKMVNTAIYIGSALVLLVSVFLVRTQTPIGDQSWMSAMIPHHSIAILTSENANINDVRVKALANDIIEAQRREIREMDWLLEDIQTNGIAETETDAQQRPVPDFEAQP